MSNIQIATYIFVFFTSFVSGRIEKQVVAGKLRKQKAIRIVLAWEFGSWSVFAGSLYVFLKLNGMPIEEHLTTTNIAIVAAIVVILTALQLFNIYTKAEVAEIEHNV